LKNHKEFKNREIEKNKPFLKTLAVVLSVIPFFNSLSDVSKVWAEENPSVSDADENNKIKSIKSKRQAAWLKALVMLPMIGGIPYVLYRCLNQEKIDEEDGQKAKDKNGNEEEEGDQEVGDGNEEEEGGQGTDNQGSGDGKSENGKGKIKKWEGEPNPRVRSRKRNRTMKMDKKQKEVEFQANYLIKINKEGKPDLGQGVLDLFSILDKFASLCSYDCVYFSIGDHGRSESYDKISKFVDSCQPLFSEKGNSCFEVLRKIFLYQKISYQALEIKFSETRKTSIIDRYYGYEEVNCIKHLERIIKHFNGGEYIEDLKEMVESLISEIKYGKGRDIRRVLDEICKKLRNIPKDQIVHAKLIKKD
jgi:hypothetical protein